jgi:hypothetical protein
LDHEAYQEMMVCLESLDVKEKTEREVSMDFLDLVVNLDWMVSRVSSVNLSNKIRSHFLQI